MITCHVFDYGIVHFIVIWCLDRVGCSVPTATLVPPQQYMLTPFLELQLTWMTDFLLTNLTFLWWSVSKIFNEFWTLSLFHFYKATYLVTLYLYLLLKVVRYEQCCFRTYLDFCLTLDYIFNFLGSIICFTSLHSSLALSVSLLKSGSSFELLNLNHFCFEVSFLMILECLTSDFGLLICMSLMT